MTGAELKAIRDRPDWGLRIISAVMVWMSMAFVGGVCLIAVKLSPWFNVMLPPALCLCGLWISAAVSEWSTNDGR